MDQPLTPDDDPDLDPEMREAMKVLIAKGLVEIMPGHGHGPEYALTSLGRLKGIYEPEGLREELERDWKKKLGEGEGQ